MQHTLGKTLISGQSPATGNPAPQLWANPDLGPAAAALGQSDISMADVIAAEARLARFAPVLRALFPETAATRGIVESPLIPLHADVQRTLRPAGTPEDDAAGRFWIKADHALPIAGSIKARGGIHEVLEFAEALAQRHGLLDGTDDYLALAGPAARALYGRHEISVGSTGNLGLSIGIVASALGFRATVHMSADAKQWKKDKLRAHGAHVVEHTGDYAQAVHAGRERAAADPHAYFVDDERSRSLFLGYAVAALRLRGQLQQAGITVDATHPLLVYLPCGVGGAPSGIAFGLKLLFGDAVHCWFVEPTAAACFLTRLQHPDRPGITVYDAGMDNRTEADGLAVPAASELAIAQMRPLLAGVATTDDDTLFLDLYRLRHSQGVKVEPSAAAALSGPRMLLGTEAGRAWLEARGLAEHLPQAAHIVWSTGGLFVPDAEYADFLARGQVAAEHAR